MKNEVKCSMMIIGEKVKCDGESEISLLVEDAIPNLTAHRFHDPFLCLNVDFVSNIFIYPFCNVTRNIALICTPSIFPSLRHCLLPSYPPSFPQTHLLSFTHSLPHSHTLSQSLPLFFPSHLLSLSLCLGQEQYQPEMVEP